MIIASLYPTPFDVQDRHDVSAAIICNGEVYAYEEDKITTCKQEPTVKFPERSLWMGMKHFGITPSDVDVWVFPTPRREPRLEDMHLFFSWFLKAYLGDEQSFEEWYRRKVRFVDHHMSHAAMAVLTSPFDDALFISQDGGGDFGDPRDLVWGEYRNGEFKTLGEHRGLNTICSLHAFITDAVGFGGENGKTSGLAAYGTVQPALLAEWKQLVRVSDEGIDFDRHRFARTAVNLGKIRPQEYERGKILNRFPSDTNIFRACAGYLPQDIAATGEYLVQQTFLEFLERLRRKSGLRRACFAGGLFLNVALNREIAASGMFDDVFFSMAPHDAGMSLGGALLVENEFTPRRRDRHMSAYLGPCFHNDEVETLLQRFRLIYSKVEDAPQRAAGLIADGKVVGWFRGRAEHGQRSLGARSILADPRTLESKSRINQRLKRRDWFMPYAPAILHDHLSDWAMIAHHNSYMQVAQRVQEDKRPRIPSAVHVDGTARFQSVNPVDNPGFHALIAEFHRLTGLPMVLNTSFNRHGIATIATPRQAIEHLLEGSMDVLFVEDFMVRFEDNRLAVEAAEETLSEEELLLEDCVKRLSKVIEMGTPHQLCQYLEALGKLAGGQALLTDGRLVIGGRDFGAVAV